MRCLYKFVGLFVLKRIVIWLNESIYLIKSRLNMEIKGSFVVFIVDDV